MPGPGEPSLVPDRANVGLTNDDNSDDPGRSKSFLLSVGRGSDSELDQGLTNFYQAQTPNRQKEGYGPVGIVAVVIICEPF